MNILLIEDDRSTMKAVKFALNQKGHKVVLASNEANAFKQLKENEVDMIVSDVNLPASAPITDLVWKLKSEYKHLPIVLISSILDNPLIDESLIQGADAFIPKPIDFELLTTVVERLDPHASVK